MVRITKEPEIRRNEIIQAAAELFQQNGYKNVTMKKVMDKLNIAKGTIYHYFDSREQLLEAVAAEIVEKQFDAVVSKLDFQGNAVENMRMLIQAGRMDSGEDGLLDRLNSPGNTGMHTHQLVMIIRKMAPLYEKIIRQGCEEGVFQVENPHEASEFILTGVFFMIDSGVFPWKQEDLTRKMKVIPELIETLLKAPTGTFDDIFQE